MQIQQTSSVAANNDLTPATNLPPKQKNWNNTIANITGLTAGLAAFTIITNDEIRQIIKLGVACELQSQTGLAQGGCIDEILNIFKYVPLAITAFSLTVGV